MALADFSWLWFGWLCLAALVWLALAWLWFGWLWLWFGSGSGLAGLAGSPSFFLYIYICIYLHFFGALNSSACRNATRRQIASILRGRYSAAPRLPAEFLQKSQRTRRTSVRSPVTALQCTSRERGSVLWMRFFLLCLHLGEEWRCPRSSTQSTQSASPKTNALLPLKTSKFLKTKLLKHGALLIRVAFKAARPQPGRVIELTARFGIAHRIAEDSLVSNSTAPCPG